MADKKKTVPLHEDRTIDAIGQFSKLELEPGDIVVLELKAELPVTTVLRIGKIAQEAFKTLFPENKWLILPPGAELKTLSEADMRRLGWVKVSSEPLVKEG